MENPKMQVLIAISFIFLWLSHTTVLADQEAGRNVFFSRCIACHAFGCNKVGPKLGDLFGRRSGTVSDYSDYSDAMKNANIIWNEKTIDAYIANPEVFIPGNGMSAAFGKLDSEVQRRDLIDYLKDPDYSMDICF